MSKLTTALIALVALAVGYLVRGPSDSRASAEGSAPTAVVTRSVVRDIPTVSTPDPTRALLLARMAQLELRQTALEADAGASSQRHDELPPSLPPRPSPQRAAQTIAQLQSTLTRTHDEEPADPSWSPQASQAFTAHLDEIREEAGFQIVRADCRATTCLAEIQWSECRRGGAGSLVLQNHSMIRDSSSPISGCVAQLVLSLPTSGAESQLCRGTYHFNCQPTPVSTR